MLDIKTVFVCLLGFALGVWATIFVSEDKIAKLKAEHAEVETALTVATVKAIAQAKLQEAIAEELEQRQLALEAQTRQILKERDDAIRKATRGDVCLRAPVLGLLNAHAPIDPVSPDDLPPPADGLADAAAAPAADPGELAASDTDVALWAAGARDAYDQCRGRVDAVRIFFEQEREGENRG
jgi:hypothetical protein